MPFTGMAIGLGQAGSDIAQGVIEGRERKRRYEREDIEKDILELQRQSAGVVAVLPLPDRTVRVIERSTDLKKYPTGFKVTTLGQEDSVSYMQGIRNEFETGLAALPKSMQGSAKAGVDRLLSMGQIEQANKLLDLYERSASSPARFRTVTGEVEGHLREAAQDKAGGPYFDPETGKPLENFKPITQTEYNRKLRLEEEENTLKEGVAQGLLTPEDAQRISTYLDLPASVIPSTSVSTTTDPSGLRTTTERQTRKGLSAIQPRSVGLASQKPSRAAREVLGKVPDTPTGDWKSAIGMAAWRYLKGQSELPKKESFREAVENFITQKGISLPETLALRPEVRNGLKMLHGALYGDPKNSDPDMRQGLADTLDVFDSRSSRARLMVAWGTTQPASLQGLMSRMFLSLASMTLNEQERDYFRQMNRAIGDINVLRQVTGLPRATQTLMDRYAIELANPWTSKSKSEARRSLALVQRQIEIALKSAPENVPEIEPSGKQPAGATITVPGSDGKMHWSDGKSDLGIVQ